MQFDFTGAELFLAYTTGQASIQQVLDHPAYRTICEHAHRYSSGLTAQDVEEALAGKPSPFFGLDGFPDRSERIQTLLGFIRKNATAWTGTVHTILGEMFPKEDLDITIYPLIGYDMGIGLGGVVCMNCNCRSYLDEPNEFLFFIIHECVHVIYERHHRIKPLVEVISPAQWLSYYHLWVQNEGYAVYVPLRLRLELGGMADRDYRVLSDPEQLEAHRLAFLETLQSLQKEIPHSRDEYIDSCFGPMRLTYRIGCELIRRIENRHGRDAVREAFYMDGDRFIETYKHLLDLR